VSCTSKHVHTKPLRLLCMALSLQVQPTAAGARNYSQCDSMLIGDRAGANTYPYIQVRWLPLGWLFR